MADLFMMDNATWIKILSKGVITIPKEFREAINLKDGDIAKAWIEGNRLILEPFRGSLGAEEPQVQVVQETPLRQDSAGPASTRGEQSKEEKKVVPQEPMDVLERIEKLEETQKMPILNPDTGRPWDAVDKTDTQKETSQYEKEQDDLKKLLESWRVKGESLDTQFVTTPEENKQNPLASVVDEQPEFGQDTQSFASSPVVPVQPIAPYEKPVAEWNNPFVREETPSATSSDTEYKGSNTTNLTDQIHPTSQIPSLSEPVADLPEAPTALWNPVEEHEEMVASQNEPQVVQFQNPQDYLYNPQQVSHREPEVTIDESSPAAPVVSAQPWMTTPPVPQAPIQPAQQATQFSSSSPNTSEAGQQNAQPQIKPNNGFQFPPLKSDINQE